MKDHLSRSRPPLTPHCDVAIPQKSYLEPIVFPGFCTTKRPLDRGAVLKEIRKHLATKGLCKQLPTQPWNPHTSLAVAGMRGRGRFVQVICGTLQEHGKKHKKGNVMTNREGCETNRIVSYCIVLSMRSRRITTKSLVFPIQV